nr:MAG TPA: hypothetical protein [Caudoviricetes sp.]
MLCFNFLIFKLKTLIIFKFHSKILYITFLRMGFFYMLCFFI